ncbi:iron-sulfur cluster assembly accessory protein [bacterium]|nr:iron-sulfur cluster assembly accessory protein [bacterium]
MIHLTANAIEEIKRRLASRPASGAVRIGVQPGGCAGTKYLVEIVDGLGEDDHVCEQDGVRILCAAADLERISGLTVDWVEAIVGGGFHYDNPNATTRCACGQSFDTK